MLINNNEAEKRLNSPLNLMNRLRRESPSSRSARNAMSLFTKKDDSSNSFNPFSRSETSISVPETKVITPEVVNENGSPKLDDILDNAEDKVKMKLIHDNALDVLSASITQIKTRIPEINKAEKLADVATKMSKIVNDIRAERKGDDGKTKQVHLHFYTPERKKLDEFESVEV